MRSLVACLALLLTFAPNYTADTDAGPLRRLVRGTVIVGVRTARVGAAVAAAPVRVWSRSREARGLPAIFPAVRAAAGGGSCGASAGAACADGSCSQPAAAATCRTLPDGSVVCDVPQAAGVGASPRATLATEWANYLDWQVGHRVGRGPLRRAMSASPAVQKRIVDRFNSTIGAREGVVVDSVIELIEWIAENPDKVMKVVQLILSIIGLF